MANKSSMLLVGQFAWLDVLSYVTLYIILEQHRDD